MRSVERWEVTLLAGRRTKVTRVIAASPDEAKEVAQSFEGRESEFAAANARRLPWRPVVL